MTSAKSLMHLGIEQGFTSLQIFQPDEFLYRNEGANFPPTPSINWHLRGAGYWRWKPHIIYQTLSQVKPNSWVLYIDSGILINITRENLKQLLRMGGDDTSVHLWQNESVEPLVNWTHPYVIAQLNLSQLERESALLYAGMIAVKNDESGKNFIIKWKSLCDTDDFLFPDLMMPSSCLPENYIWHRHDQSLLSIVACQNPSSAKVHNFDETSLAPTFIIHRQSQKRYLFLINKTNTKRYLWHKVVKYVPILLRQRVRVFLTKKRKSISVEELQRHKKYF